MAASPSSRDWTGIFISILVILSIMGLVALVVRALPPDNSHTLHQERVSVADIVGGRFKQNNIMATWVAGKIVTMSCNMILTCNVVR